MNKIKKIAVILSLALLSFSAKIYAQTDKVTIDGGGKTVYFYTKDVLDKLPQTIIKAKDHGNVLHTYKGVELFILLKKAGAPLTNELRGKNLQKYILIDALDGYKAVFSLPEIDPTFANRKIILATTMDGQLLSSAQGPFQIIIEGEKKLARYVRQVKSVSIKQAK